MRINQGSLYRVGERAREDQPQVELLPSFLGAVVIIASSAVCWALIYAVFASSYHLFSGVQ